jgi:hypothetical protein
VLINQAPNLALEAALGISDPSTSQEVRDLLLSSQAWNPAALARWRDRISEKN